jgi:mono/diheme cytochrome c family protein
MRLVVCCSLLVLAAAPIRAQDSSAAPAGPLASKGVYGAGQAERGERFFAKVCIECHETFEFSTRQFDKAWVGKTAFDFVDLVKTTMPDDKPGTLKREDIIDVLAYIFKLNAYPAGADLPDDDEKLRAIQIDARPAAPPGAAPGAAHGTRRRR